MSESNRNTSSEQSSQGSGNQSGNRNRNRNRNRNQQGQGGGNREGGGNNQRRRNNGGNSGSGSRRRSSKPKPLTLFERIKKFFGLYKDPKNNRSSKKGARQNTRKPKENVRDASGRMSSKDSSSGGKTARARQKRRPTPDSSQVEGQRLYVGNLSYDAAEHDLEDLFKGVGAVRKIEIVYNRNTHRSKGYGFVEMARIDEAKRAVEVLHDQPFMGRTLIVNGAKSKGAVDADGDPAPQENPPPNLPENEE